MIVQQMVDDEYFSFKGTIYKEKRVRIPDKRAKGYDKRVWAHSLVVHNLVNRSL